MELQYSCICVVFLAVDTAVYLVNTIKNVRVQKASVLSIEGCSLFLHVMVTCGCAEHILMHPAMHVGPCFWYVVMHRSFTGDKQFVLFFGLSERECIYAYVNMY